MRAVRLHATGHPDVTGRHDKTLELTAEHAITARATCILGVAAGPLPGELPLLRGRVRLTIAAGGSETAVEGEVNPGYHSAERLIVRRSGQRDPDTFLVNADKAAADLPRPLIDALTHGAGLTVTAEEAGLPDRVVLVVTGGPATTEIERLAAQADLVVDLTPRGAPPPPVPITAPRVHKVPAEVGQRTMLVLTKDAADALPLTTGARVVLWPPGPGADLLLSAGRAPFPLLTAGPFPSGAGDRHELARLLAGTRVPLVLDVPDGTDLTELAPRHTVLAPAPEVGWGVRPGGDHGLSVLIPPETDALTVDPAELARLLRRTATGRDTAAVLTGLGVPKKEAYRLAAESASEPR